MRAIITIDLHNVPDDRRGAYIRYALRELADRVNDTGASAFNLRVANGNAVGTFRIENGEVRANRDVMTAALERIETLAQKGRDVIDADAAHYRAIFLASIQDAASEALAKER